MKTGTIHQFQGTIYKIWLMRHVDVPEQIGKALATECAGNGSKSRKKEMPKHIPVVASTGGKSQRTTLVPAGGGRYRLQLNTALRKAARADAGELIGVSLRYDADSREVELPAELRTTLREHSKARKEFERLPAGHRRQLLLYYLRAKSAKAREKVALRLIDHLLERAMLGTGKKRKKK